LHVHMRDTIEYRPPRLGIITTGHGPRTEYLRYHGNVLRHLGLPDVEIVARHSLEDLSPDEIDSMAPVADEPLIGGHVRAPGATGDRMGGGYREVLVARRLIIPLVQQRIDELDAEKVDAIIFCCAEEYPADAFSAMRPLIVPFRLVLAFVADAAGSLRRPFRVAVLTPGERWSKQDEATWRSEALPRSVEPVVIPLAGAPEAVAARVRDEIGQVDLAVLWGYGIGIAPFDPADLVGRLERGLGAPVVSVHALACRAARSLLRPSQDDLPFAVAPEPEPRKR